MALSSGGLTHGFWVPMVVHAEASPKHGFSEFYQRVFKKAGNNSNESLLKIRSETVLKQELARKKNISQEVEDWQKKARKEPKQDQRNERAQSSKPPKGRLPVVSTDSNRKSLRKRDRGAINELNSVSRGLKFGRSTNTPKNKSGVGFTINKVGTESSGKTLRFNSQSE